MMTKTEKRTLRQLAQDFLITAGYRFTVRCGNTEYCDEVVPHDVYWDCDPDVLDRNVKSVKQTSGYLFEIELEEEKQ